MLSFRAIFEIDGTIFDALLLIIRKSIIGLGLNNL